MNKLFFSVLLIIGIASVAQADTSSPLQALSAWINQSGSTLYIDSISSNGQLTGTYI